VCFVVALFLGFWLKVVWPTTGLALPRAFFGLSQDRWFDIIQSLLLLSGVIYLKSLAEKG